MSDFRVVKCKNCDAGLVEMQGQKLNRCVQCGYRFSLSKSSSSQAKMPSQNSVDLFNQTPEPEIQDIINELKGTKASTSNNAPNSQIKSTKTLPLKKKKKSNIIGTIIFYIILFNVLRAVLGF